MSVESRASYFLGISVRFLGLLWLLILSGSASGDTEYYRHILFDNSVESDAYYYSAGKASAPSTLELDHGKLPVRKTVFYTPPNALRLKWRSVPDGGWEASVRAINFRNREISFGGDVLYFWCFSEEGIPASDLPLIQLSDANRDFSKPLKLKSFVQDLPAGKWVQVRIPLQEFKTGSIHSFQPDRTERVVFVQDAADSADHALIIDEIKIYNAADSSTTASAPPSNLPAPRNLSAESYERHIDIRWDPVEAPELQRYVIYRSWDNRDFQPIGIQVPGINRYTDYLDKTGQTAFYKIAASDRRYRKSPFSESVTGTTRSMSDEELLTMLQEACFRYYWEGAHPVAGMTLENIPGDDRIVATGASGFGIMALIVGVDRGFISRDQGLERLAKIVSFLESAPRYHGVWPHFMDGETGQTLPVFDMFDNGGDLVETAFLMEGLLAARQYFKGPSERERNLFARISHLWEAVEGAWSRRSPQSDALYWHWSPEWSWYINHRLTGFNEAMIVYLLAVASPTHAVPAELYYSGCANQGAAGA